MDAWSGAHWPYLKMLSGGLLVREVMKMNATSSLDSVPDLIAPSLEMGRPELAPLMQRYSHRGEDPPMPLLGHPTALLVTRHDEEGTGLKRMLEAEGWYVSVCKGPGLARCPIMRGSRCTMRESVDATVVYLSGDSVGNAASMLPRLRCAADSASPSIVVLEDRADEARFGDRNATIGALQGSGSIVHAIHKLLKQEES